MSRIGAKASRARKEAKIRAVLTDPRVRTEIQEWIAPRPEPIPRRYVEEPIVLRETAITDRTALLAFACVLALGIAYAFYSFLNP